MHFGGAISELANRLTVHLQLIQNRDNLSALELEQKKKEIEKGMTELKRVLEEEVERIFSKCRNQLPEQVASDIRSVLEQNRNQLKASAQGDLQARIQGLVTNTLRQSLTDRSRPVFNESLKRLSTYVSEHIYNVIEPGTATYSTGMEPALISGGNKEDLPLSSYWFRRLLFRWAVIGNITGNGGRHSRLDYKAGNGRKDKSSYKRYD